MNGISGMGYAAYAVYGRNGVYGLQNPAEKSVPEQSVSEGNKLPSKEGNTMPALSFGAAEKIPFLREGADTAELAVRMRMEYPLAGNAASDNRFADGRTDAEGGVEGIRETAKEGECQTCKERKYQDGSDDSGVSYQTPTHISPEQAASKVRGHEMEHVYREGAKAKREDRKVVSQTVTLHTAICPECGRAYISGGTTRTTTAAAKTPADDAVSAQETRRPFSAVA